MLQTHSYGIILEDSYLLDKNFGLNNFLVFSIFALWEIHHSFLHFFSKSNIMETLDEINIYSWWNK